jgi:D-threo-aldose 1-dehydrogenase
MGGRVVSYEPFEPVALGRRGPTVTRLGFGTAEIGGIYRAVSDEDAAAVLAHAWDIGVRYFDTAPLYGYGNAERRLGTALRGVAAADVVLSTKVGRLIVPREEVPPGADVDRQARDGVEDAYYHGTPPARVVFDYSGDGVRRSVDESLRRLGRESVDMLLIHDPDDHWRAAIDEAYPALHRLREEGVVRAIGAGMNQSAMLARFAREGDFDAFLLAGRYTLLDHEALAELLPVCMERGVAIVVGGVMNSGLLVDPKPGATFNYDAAPPAIVARAQRLAEVCRRHDVPLRAAAIQFPLAHPAVRALVTGVRTAEHLDDYPTFMRLPIPNDLWAELRAEGLIPVDVPVPTSRAEERP